MTDAPPRTRTSTHPLLGVFPLTVMALATFLVVFALLLARVNSGVGPTFTARTRAVSSLAGPSSGGPTHAGAAVLTTRASGVAGAPAPQPVGSATPAEPSVARALTITTRSSGRQGHDD